MIQIEEETDIDAPPEQVFDYLSDPHNHLDFTPSLTNIDDVQSNEVGKRGTFTFKLVGTSLEGRFTDVEFERPNRRSYELEGDLDGTVTWDVEQAGDGSRVRYTSSLDTPGPDIVDAITDRVASRFLEREARSTLENLRILVEEGDVTQR